MKRLLSFSDSTLTRSEMKNVKGGEWTGSANCSCTGPGGKGKGGFMGSGTISDIAWMGNYYCGGNYKCALKKA